MGATPTRPDWRSVLCACLLLGCIAGFLACVAVVQGDLAAQRACLTAGYAGGLLRVGEAYWCVGPGVAAPYVQAVTTRRRDGTRCDEAP